MYVYNDKARDSMKEDTGKETSDSHRVEGEYCTTWSRSMRLKAELQAHHTHEDCPVLKTISVAAAWLVRACMKSADVLELGYQIHESWAGTLGPFDAKGGSCTR